MLWALQRLLPGTNTGERGLELLRSGHALPYTVLPDVWHVKAFRKVQEKGQEVGSTVGGLKELVRAFRRRRTAADGLVPSSSSELLDVMTEFAFGIGPVGIVFNGANIWVANRVFIGRRGGQILRADPSVRSRL